MKKAMKIATIAMVVCMIILSSTMVLAAPDPSGYKGNDNFESEKLNNFGNNIISIITTIGSIASVIVLVVLGIKYMMGSAEEKAEYKKTLLPYVIGAVLVFAASTIASVVYNMSTNGTLLQ